MWFTNSNDETLWRFLLVYYTLSEIHCLTQYHDYWHAVLHISTNATSFGCIWIQSPHTIDFHGCTREILGLDGTNGPFCLLPFYGSNVIDIHAKSPSDPGLLDDRSCDHRTWRLQTRTTTCSPRWSLTIQRLIYVQSVEDVCIPMITRFDRLMFVFRDMEGKMIRLNWQIRAAVDDWWWRVWSKVKRASLPLNQFSMIKVFGNTTLLQRRKWNWTILFLSFFRSISGYNLVCVVGIRDFVLHNVPTDQVVLINAGETIQRDHDFTNAVHTNIETIIAMLNASDALVQSGIQWWENAFHVTVNHFFFFLLLLLHNWFHEMHQRSNRSSDSNRTPWRKGLVNPKRVTYLHVVLVQ